MSRSIHATRDDLERERGDREVIREQLRRKRTIKRQVRAQRRSPRGPQPPSTPPIRVLAPGPHVHHGASAADLEAVMARLPAGLLDGVESIELSLGHYASGRAGGDASSGDPITGRRGSELLPGVWSGAILGRYHVLRRRIQVFAFVVAEPVPTRWRALLRLEALSTFVHEVAHHDDHVTRVARGRWRADTRGSVEGYAERREAQWTREVVVPWLEQTYPDDVAALLAWVRERCGVDLRLVDLVDAAPRTLRSGLQRVVMGTPRDAVTAAARAEPRSPEDARVEFARQVHYGDRYEEALCLVDQVLAVAPDHLAALALRADLLEHLERHHEAAVVARAVLERDPEHDDAWQTLSYVHEHRQEWAALHEAAERRLALIEAGRVDAWHRPWVLLDRARARIGRGDVTGARSDLDAAAARWTFVPPRLRKLRALLDAAGAAGASPAGGPAW